MNSNEQFLNKDNEIIDVEPITVQPEVSSATVQLEDSSADTGMGSLAAGVVGAVVGAVAGAVAGGLAAKATPDDAGDKIKDAAENVADKVKDAAEHAKPSLESAADKVKNAAPNAGDRIEDAAEGAKTSIESATDKAKAAAKNTANRVEDAAERAKPSNHQDAQDVEIRERIVIEPTSDVVAETTLPSDKEHSPEGELLPMDVYEETPDSEIEKPSFARKVDQLYQE